VAFGLVSTEQRKWDGSLWLPAVFSVGGLCEMPVPIEACPSLVVHLKTSWHWSGGGRVADEGL